MYRKIHTLMQQLESKTVDVEKARLLLNSIMEQTDASGNSEAYIMAYNAWSLMPEYHEKINPIRENLELLMWSLAEKDIEKIERLLTQQKGLDFDKIEEYRDAGILTEHFTVCGNLFCLLKREKRILDGPKRLIQLAAFLKDGKVGMLSMNPNNTLAEAMTAIDMLLMAKKE